MTTVVMTEYSHFDMLTPDTLSHMRKQDGMYKQPASTLAAGRTMRCSKVAALSDLQQGRQCTSTVQVDEEDRCRVTHDVLRDRVR